MIPIILGLASGIIHFSKGAIVTTFIIYILAVFFFFFWLVKKDRF